MKMADSRHVVRIFDGYGGVPTIMLDEFEAQSIKRYELKGTTGGIPELTITIDASNVIFQQNKPDTQEDA